MAFVFTKRKESFLMINMGTVKPPPSLTLCPSVFLILNDFASNPLMCYTGIVFLLHKHIMGSLLYSLRDPRVGLHLSLLGLCNTLAYVLLPCIEI